MKGFSAGATMRTSRRKGIFGPFKSFTKTHCPSTTTLIVVIRRWKYFEIPCPKPNSQLRQSKRLQVVSSWEPCKDQSRPSSRIQTKVLLTSTSSRKSSSSELRFNPGLCWQARMSSLALYLHRSLLEATTEERDGCF
jgi:hypothetical protein